MPLCQRCRADAETWTRSDNREARGFFGFLRELYRKERAEDRKRRRVDCDNCSRCCR